MINLTTTDLVFLPGIVVGWLCVAAYGVVYCGTRAFYKSKDRVLSEWNSTNED